jgi:hypothetical protein
MEKLPLDAMALFAFGSVLGVASLHGSNLLHRSASASLPIWSLYVIVHGEKSSTRGMALGRVMLQQMGLRWRWLLYGIR